MMDIEEIVEKLMELHRKEVKAVLMTERDWNIVEDDPFGDPSPRTVSTVGTLQRLKPGTWEVMSLDHHLVFRREDVVKFSTDRQSAKPVINLVW